MLASRKLCIISILQNAVVTFLLLVLSMSKKIFTNKIIELKIMIYFLNKLNESM